MDSKASHRLLKIRKRLGEKLEALIQERGYPSLESFALANGFHKATVHQVVRAKADPRFSTLVRLADALEIPVEDLINNLSKGS